MADIYGQLIKAQLENLTSDPSSPPEGLVYFKTDTNLIRFYDGSAWHSVMDLDSTQTATNKTLTSPQVNTGTLLTPVIDDYMDVNEESAPATPSAGKVRVYAKTDKQLYTKDSAGVETPLAGGVVGSGIKVVSGAPYTITDTDGYDTFLVSNDHTVTLPAVANNSGRTLKIKKVDAASGGVTIDTPGAETIDGSATHILYTQYSFVIIISDGTSWHILASQRGPSTIFLNGGSGTGSGNTKVRRYTTAVTTTGNDLALTQSATDGDSIECRTAGVYAIHVGDTATSTNDCYITRNSTSVAPADPDNLASQRIAANTFSVVSTTVYLAAGDVVRWTVDNNATLGSSAAFVWLRITKIN
jgi:hypothetical protein